jgi:hypothetical protein
MRRAGGRADGAAVEGGTVSGAPEREDQSGGCPPQPGRMTRTARRSEAMPRRLPADGWAGEWRRVPGAVGGIVRPSSGTPPVGRSSGQHRLRGACEPGQGLGLTTDSTER